KYGALTLFVTLIVVLLLPVYKYLNNKVLYNQFSKIARRIKINALRYNIIVLNLSVIKLIIFWTLILGILTFAELHQDLLFLAKRLGRVSTACLPTILFLSLRPSPLPNMLYLALLPIHKWLSRIIVLQGLAHTIIYLLYFNFKNTWSKAYKIENIYGIIALLGFLIIAFTSLPIVRRLNYKVFYINHYIFTWIIVICLFFHARPGIPYITTLNVAILIYQIIYRIRNTKKTKVDVINISSHLTLILIPNSAISQKSGAPGSHLRIIDHDPSKKFQNIIKNYLIPMQHPYTITTLPVDSVQKLIVRNSNFRFDKNKIYYVTGAFLPHLDFLTPRRKGNAKSLLYKVKCKRCLIVVGGSAISFALPILRVLNYNGCIVKIVWVARDIEDLKILNYFANSIIENDCLDVYVTGNYDEETKNAFTAALMKKNKLKNTRDLRGESKLLSGEIDFNNEFDNGNAPLLESSNQNYGSTKLSDSSIKTLTPGKGKKNDLNLNSNSNSKHKCFSPLHRKKSLCNNNNNNITAGFVDNNEIDFNQAQNMVSDIRTDSSNNQNMLSLLADLVPTVKIDFGRPKLGSHYYSWCINQTCNDKNDELYLNEHFIRNKKKYQINDDVWVLAAGPTGLVDNVKLWANDCGFHFHEERFGV
ncbi:hypothetical protein PACTADRAFT_30325, partial [Pachysolen tannophilus NRRL Y-2460]